MDTYTSSQTFSVLHAKQITAKVATDLLRFQHLYGHPTDSWIDEHEKELIELLKHDVVDEVVFGFERDDKWSEASIRYKSLPGGNLTVSDDPGRIKPGLDVTGAKFNSCLTYNAKWRSLNDAQRQEIMKAYTLRRTTVPAMSLENGCYWSDDHTYAAGGRGLGRSSAKS